VAEPALAARLARLGAHSTCRLTHYGRKSGKPYQVTLWFTVDGDTIWLSTARSSRQWVRNVQKNPRVELAIGGDTISGRVEQVHERDLGRRVMELVTTKYWYLRPFVGAIRLFGRDPIPDASFRVRIEDGAKA
jgi:deazaflavin-dependent oxidoreductase (nitroreductase family)